MEKDLLASSEIPLSNKGKSKTNPKEQSKINSKKESNIAVERNLSKKVESKANNSIIEKHSKSSLKEIKSVNKLNQEDSQILESSVHSKKSGSKSRSSKET